MSDENSRREQHWHEATELFRMWKKDGATGQEIAARVLTMGLTLIEACGFTYDQVNEAVLQHYGKLLHKPPFAKA